MEVMFKIGDLIKDKDKSNKRYIKCAKIIDINYIEHEVKLCVYDSSTSRMGSIWMIWMSEYRFRKMNKEEISSYIETIEKGESHFHADNLLNEMFDTEKQVFLDYFKPLNQKCSVVFK